MIKKTRKKSGKEMLQKELSQMASGGIRIDAAHLKRNISSQFPHPRYCWREYVTNSHDAGARTVWISGSKGRGRLTISVRDDGRGMNQVGVEAFLTKFQSRKDHPAAVGRFGVGSFSVAALPGQCGFSMLTSTGTETWRLTTGCLLNCKPIVVERIEPVLPCGTTFEVTFARRGQPLHREMRAICEMLRKQIRFLNIRVLLEFPPHDKRVSVMQEALEPGCWAKDHDESYARRYCARLDGLSYDIVLALGPTRWQLYQHGVLITEDRTDHHLLCQDRADTAYHPEHLSIRLESPDFEMPLGRHVLSDTDTLKPLAAHIRKVLLPEFLDELVQPYETGTIKEYSVLPSHFEELLAGWMAGEQGKLPERFRRVAIFRTYAGKRLALEALQSAVRRHKALYLEDPEGNGMDYSVFDAPVLSVNQPRGGLEFITEHFGEHLINLSVADLVQNAPAGTRPQLSERERKLGSMLGFTREAIMQCRRKEQNLSSPSRPGSQLSQRLRLQYSRQAIEAMAELEAIEWELGYLVGRDGKTPAAGALFLCRENRVVLNLHHPDIRKLVELCEHAPNLAGHYATVMCLSTQGRSNILPHLSAELREDLANLDAVARCGRSEAPLNHRPRILDGPKDRLNMNDFLRHITEDDFPF